MPVAERKTGRLTHALNLGREFLTHWAAAGLIIALTGLAPEHWFAELFHSLAIPDSFWRGWAEGADIRGVLVAVGVAIIAWDVVRRTRRDTSADGLHPQVQTANASALVLPDKPSIAVLPFQNMSADPEQDYFADGITEDLITALSKVRWFFVISRTSSFTYKGKPVDVKQAGSELGVRYILEGSVRKVSEHVRITAQLGSKLINSFELTIRS